eukprot:GHVU01229046.1.p2 GENE.GHVU01229046.1~~GHVU01229046.1.p2  ORF type:complete len:114 (+),score=7.65 GHVU01229046.1:342-683(+)
MILLFLKRLLQWVWKEFACYLGILSTWLARRVGHQPLTLGEDGVDSVPKTQIRLEGSEREPRQLKKNGFASTWAAPAHSRMRTAGGGNGTAKAISTAEAAPPGSFRATGGCSR